VFYSTYLYATRQRGSPEWNSVKDIFLAYPKNISRLITHGKGIFVLIHAQLLLNGFFMGRGNILRLPDVLFDASPTDVWMCVMNLNNDTFLGKMMKLAWLFDISPAA